MKPAAVKIWIGCLAMAAALAIGYGLFHWHSTRRISTALDRIAEALPGVASIEAGRISTGFFEGRIELEDLSVRLAPDSPAVFIDSVKILDADFTHPVPRKMHVIVQGGQVRPLFHFPQLAGQFPDGVIPDSVRLNLDAVYFYRPDTGELDLQQFSLTAEPLGELSFEGHFDNLDLERIFQEPVRPVEMFGALVGARIRDAAITYRDRSLVRETVRSQAKRRGRTPARHARILVETLRFRGEGPPGGLLARTLEPLKGFLADPEFLRVRFDPEKPVTVGWLLWVRDPERLIELLGLQIEP